MQNAELKKTPQLQHLLVIGAAGLVVAKTASAFVTTAIAPTPEVVGRAKGSHRTFQPRDEGNERSPLVALLDRNLFCANREDIAPKKEAPDEARPTSSFTPELCKPSSMSTTLLGTMVGKTAETSVAIFQDPLAERAIVARIGDKLLDQATIKSIKPREVWVDRDRRCEKFSLDEEELSRTRQDLAPPSPPESRKPELGANIRKVSANQYEIPKAEFDRILGNLGSLAPEGRIVPSFENGVPNGFKLFSIRSNGLYGRIGIQDGDIIHRINGFEMSSPEQAFEIYARLKDATSITIDLVRRGKALSLNYDLR